MKPTNWIYAAAVVVALVAGCDKSAPQGQANTARPKARVRLAFVSNNAADFWAIARAGCNKAVADLGNVDLDFRIPADGAAATQKSIVEDLLAKGVDGIAISPIDPANQTLLLNEVAKQALLITQDSDAPQSDRACYLGTDNVAAGRQAGGLIRETLPQGGKIMVFVGNTSAQNARDRLDGIKAAIQGSNVELLDVRTDDTDAVRAKANALDTMVKYPDVACLVGLWNYNGPAILNAVRDAGKVGQVKIVCFDEDAETLAGVKEGAIYATVVQQPYEFGYQAIQLMDKVITTGDKSAIPASRKIIISTLAIKQDNVDAFAAKLKTIRGH
ncbi:MAG TPA: sugar-binding protein [Verrucomicrobiae bacterium]|nr:sugar-binding protein [Verrucomicrobiae bacterium]